jgi:GNAT superfamily N-acetyltransferase
MFFHHPGGFEAKAYQANRDAKHALVEGGRAHGTIVYCGGEPVGWCQFGPREELARIDRKRGYAPTAENPWRITCLFVAPGHRRSGLAEFAVGESVMAMKKLKVRTIEAYPVEGPPIATFLWAGTTGLFERAGFSRVAPLGKKGWIYSLAFSKRAPSRPGAN